MAVAMPAALLSVRAAVLFGDGRPAGKRPCSRPRDMKQVPIDVGDADNKPLFEYGFGLTY